MNDALKVLDELRERVLDYYVHAGQRCMDGGTVRGLIAAFKDVIDLIDETKKKLVLDSIKNVLGEDSEEYKNLEACCK